MMHTRPRLEEGWSTLILLWAMMFMTAFAIQQADLISGLHVIPLVGTAAILTGTLLAKSRFSPNTAHLYALLYGAFVIFYLIGTTDSFIGMAWRERIIHPEEGMIARQFAWFGKLVDGGTSRDGLIFVFQTAVIFWLLGYTAAWYTFRFPHVWRAILPMGLVLLSVVYYYAGPRPLPYYLGIYALLAALFVARTYLVEQERTWRSTAVRYENSIWFAFARAGLIAAAIALILAWGLPPLSANAAVSDALGGTRGPWREFQDNWTRMFSALRTYGVNTADPYQDSLVLGGPRTVGNTPVMDIIVPQELPYVYWQAIVYDTYEDETWHKANDLVYEHFADEGSLDIPFTRSRQVVTQTVYSYFPSSSFIYGAPEIISADRPLLVSAREDANGDKLVSAVRAKYILQQGDRYEVVSRLSVADATSLREASTAYPSWVEATYLQLPDSITPETLALAAEVTAPYTNPYDKAMAVQSYLRETITYNDQIEAPPDTIDPVHYTLFVSQEGYCNYYASAMAVMLRSQGVPVRVVSGYAQGTYDEESHVYRVRASNAHTWVEVYFPSYGWIQFEPTASIPVITRPEHLAGDGSDPLGSFAFNDARNSASIPEEDLLEPEDPQDLIADENRGGLGTQGDSQIQGFPLWQALGAAVIVLAAVGLSWTANTMNRRVEMDVDRSYRRLGSWARWLGVPQRPEHTPYERADLLATAVPEGKDAIRVLTRQFVLKQFSRQRMYEAGFDPLPYWKGLRPLLLKKSIATRLHRWQQKSKRKRK
ncbi:MAG: transglutaminase-like domain-containing protein [Anaerolineae bacterium]|nr:transglutaminase-like domain-containing protein [Anaerolineae bacterium]